MFKITQKRLLIVACFVLASLFSVSAVSAIHTSTEETSFNVESITLTGEGASIEWTVNGESPKGFKVVWSKNSGPTYPTRKGDDYHYFTDPQTRTDVLEVFDGPGTYYVRVCEYLGGSCGVYSNEITVELGSITECTAEYDLVCGKDGKTYSNKCKLDNAGVKLWYEGECQEGETNETEEDSTSVNVESIKLEGAGSKIEWSVNGHSPKGFKVVWSLNANPTYPLRAGDKYHYYSDPNRNYDTLNAFQGSGVYYVRVCEYLGGQCGVYSNEIKLELAGAKVEVVEVGKIVCTMEYDPVCGKNGKTYANKCVAVNQNNAKIAYYGECKDISTKEKRYRFAKWTCADNATKEHVKDEPCKSEEEWEKYAQDFCGESEVIKFNAQNVCAVDEEIVEYKNKAKDIFDDKYESILAELKELRSIVKEQAAQIEYLTKLKEGVQDLTSKVEEAINNFITYGADDNTKRLGAGERAAVMYSFKQAFKKLPETEDEMADAIKIASGRWPSLRSEEMEEKAKEYFKKVYKRVADMDNPHDNAAITVMAYGLRQKAENRNLESEKKGIKIFQDIFGYHPSDTEHWNIMQAITYSGATRGVDSDGDMLTDEREAELGTDPNNRDTDGDGFMDGVEVANGYDPLYRE